MPLRVISFYTNDWIYPKHARRLRRDCAQLQIESYIKKRPTTKDYIKNTAIKPFFIRETLLKFKEPVLWLDVDGILLKEPTLLMSPLDADFAACAHFNERMGREWAVGIMWFNYTDASRLLLDEWCSRATDCTDEAAFDNAWRSLKDSVTACVLPKSYHFVKWRDSLAVPEDTIFCNQLSKSEDKLRRKYKKPQQDVADTEGGDCD